MAFSADKLRQGASGNREDYSINKSLRFNDGDGAYLSRTPSSAGNRKTWTWSGWVKRGNIGVQSPIFSARHASSGHGTQIRYSNDSLQVHEYVSGHAFNLVTTAVLRDTSAWYHIVVAFDSTQAVATDRIKIYINGIEAVDFSISSYPTLNFETYINNTGLHNLGVNYWHGSLNAYNDGYLADTHFLDGQAVGPDTFGEFNKYGQWVAKTPTFASPSFDDASNSNHKVTLHGSVTPNIGKYGQGFGFYSSNYNIWGDPSQARLSIPQHTDFDVFNNTNATVEFWINIDWASFVTGSSTYLPHWQVIGNRTNAGNGWGFSITNKTGSPGEDGFQLFLPGASSSPNSGPDTINDLMNDGWHHCAVVKENSSFKFYLDGKHVGSGTATGIQPSTATHLIIGADSRSSNENYGLQETTIDDIRISTVARYTTDFTPPTARLESDDDTVLLLQGEQMNIAEGKFGDGMEFDGVDDRIITSSNIGIAGSSDRTFSAWIYPHDVTHRGQIMAISGLDSGGRKFEFEIGWQNGELGMHGHSNIPYTSGANLQNNVWYHVAVTYTEGYTSTDALKFYVNGVHVSHIQHSTDRILNTVDAPLRIGNRYESGSESVFFDGKIKECAAWTKVLSASQIQTLYNKGVPLTATEVEATSIAAYYPLNETNGSSVFDNSTNSNHGTVYGAAPTPYGKNGFHLDFNPVDPDALYFSGTGNTFVHPPSGFTTALKNQNQGTFSGWFKMSTDAYISPYFMLIGNGTSNGYVGCGLNGDKLRFQSDSFIHMTVSLKDGGNFADNTWHHVVFASDGTTFDIYLDGVKCEIENAAHDKWFNNHVGGSDTFFGKLDRGYQSHRMKGNFKDFAFYDTKLSQENVEALYNDGNPADANTVLGSNLIGYYKMGEGTGSTVADSSGNSYTANLINTSWTVANLGNDKNGNNNFDLNNLGIEDQMLDTPNNNFCTLSPLTPGGSINLSEGNLKLSNTTGGSTSWRKVANSTIPIPTTGKWYHEVCIQASTGVQYIWLGMSEPHENVGASLITMYNGKIWFNGTYIQSGLPIPAVGDIIAICVDADAETLQFKRNNSNHGTSVDFSSLTSKQKSELVSFYGGGASGHNTDYVANFGQDSSFAGNKTAQNNTDDNGYSDFYYEPPSGFLALCTANLDDPAAGLWSDGDNVNFNTVTYTGNGSTQTINTIISNDLTWLKMRNSGGNHYIWDNVRGFGDNALNSDTTQAEGYNNQYYTISKNSTGFDITQDAPGNEVNYSGNTYVAWNWKANGSGVSNTDGSITSTVSANTTAGFSIVSFTAPGTGNFSVGHGLGSKPDLVIVKTRDSGVAPWYVWHSSFSNQITNYLRLNTTTAIQTSTDEWGAGMTSSVIGLRAGYSTVATEDHIAYCFHSVDGYSKVGSYTGNGSSDGTFVYTGFRPAYVLVKRTDSSGTYWTLFDNKRSSYNVSQNTLNPDRSNAEETSGGNGEIDMLSNGFKARDADGGTNASGGDYIYIAFAENPFKYSNAR